MSNSLLPVSFPWVALFWIRETPEPLQSSEAASLIPLNHAPIPHVPALLNSVSDAVAQALISWNICCLYLFLHLSVTKIKTIKLAVSQINRTRGAHPSLRSYRRCFSEQNKSFFFFFPSNLAHIVNRQASRISHSK